MCATASSSTSAACATRAERCRHPSESWDPFCLCLCICPCLCRSYCCCQSNGCNSQSFRPLARPGHFLLLAQEKVTKEKGLPRQGPTTGRGKGIFRLAIHGSVEKRRTSMCAALRVWEGGRLFKG